MPRRLTIREAADFAALGCLAELAAGKPGNVSLRRGLPGLAPSDFIVSAAALRAAFARRDPRRRSVGALVLDAIRRTRRRVRTNTNLGLALILAPLVVASTRRRPAGSPRREPRRKVAGRAGGGPGSLRRAVRAVLQGLTVRDAVEVYEAIRLAEPGGMGRVAREDVSQKPQRDLRSCMKLAERRDSIAAEYARDYALTFTVGAPALDRSLRAGASSREAIVLTFLRLLASRPDSLIARRRGRAAARRVSRLAGLAFRRLSSFAGGGPSRAEARRAAMGAHRPTLRASVAALDRRLRAGRLNPGTTADLTAAAVFVVLAESASHDRRGA
jgi:triphosphoribosyl-dephospho-CoA synthase